MLTLRDLRLDDDLDRYHAGSANWTGAQFLRDREASLPAEIPRLHIGADLDGVPVGAVLAVAAPARREGRGFGTGGVVPSARGRGVGTALRSRLLQELSGWSVPGVVLSAADEPHVRELMARWGHQVTGRHYTSVLDLTALDDGLVQESCARLAGSGIRLEPMGGDDAFDDVGLRRLRELYPFFCARMAEAPDAEGQVEDMPFVIFESLVGAPWRLVVAKRGEEVVGVTGVAPLSADTVNTFFTGVVDSARGLGVGLALKAYHARLLRERGLRRLVTQNMDVNAAILRSNDRLGFVRTKAYVDVEIDGPVNRQATVA